jgi:predicted nucleic acid-binding protein
MFIDSNVFISAFLDSQAPGIAARAFLGKIAKGEQNAITSALVINEVFYKLNEIRGFGQVEKAYRILLSYSHLSIMPIDDKVISNSISYMKEGLEASDAFHAAAMKVAGVSTICSYDKGFDRIKSIKRQEPK